MYPEGLLLIRTKHFFRKCKCETGKINDIGNMHNRGRKEIYFVSAKKFGICFHWRAYIPFALGERIMLQFPVGDDRSTNSRKILLACRVTKRNVMPLNNVLTCSWRVSTSCIVVLDLRGRCWTGPTRKNIHWLTKGEMPSVIL